MNPAKLYIVPTPIGNLKDITLRAIEVLKEVDEVYAEDTRKAVSLLSHYGIKKPIFSYHKDNENKAASFVIEKIKSDKKIALLSEAGTPCISDPGCVLVKDLIKEGIKFEVLPGATAFVPALIMSGFDLDHFFFYGFLRHKKSEKTKELEFLKKIYSVIVLYESPHRIKDTLKLLFDYFNPPFIVIREITKIHEERIVIKSVQDIDDLIVKGEFVVVVDNNLKETQKDNPVDEKIIENLKNEGFGKKDILKIFKSFGFKRNDIYPVLEKIF